MTSDVDKLYKLELECKKLSTKLGIALDCVKEHESHLSGKGRTRGILVRIEDMENLMEQQSHERAANKKWFLGILAGLVLAIFSPLITLAVTSSGRPSDNRLDKIEQSLQQLTNGTRVSN